MKKRFFFVFLLILITIGLFYYLSWITSVDLELGNNQSTTDKTEILIGNAIITAEIADEPQEQVQGLSGRESLGRNDGILFIFPKPGIQSFWMKDMRFSIDILWINDKFEIIDITKNISPDTFPQTFSPSQPVRYVLELNAGWSDMNNLRIGDIIKANIK